MIDIRIGGVPEHFNLPIHLAKEKGWFENEGINLLWNDFPGGSGYMREALRKEEIDLCILLTEGIVADIAHGGHSRIASGYVNTALTWGIHANNQVAGRLQEFNTPLRIAISRKGSGSHLMPIVHAMMEERPLDQLEFVEIKNMQGGIRALQENLADIFYWEKYTTKPRVVAGDIQRIGEFISPWPCFLIAASARVISDTPEAAKKVLKVIQRANAFFMQLPDAPSIASVRYQLALKDAERWYHATEWATDGWVSNKMLEGVLYTLSEAGIIADTNTLSDDLLWTKEKTPNKV